MKAVNLIPDEQRGGGSVGAGQSGGAAYAVIALVVGLALLAFLYGSAKHQISSNKQKATEITAQAQQQQAAAEQLAPYTSFLAMKEERVKDVSELVDSRFDWAHVFHEFARVLPAGVSVSALDGTVGTPTPTSSSSSASATVASATPPGTVPSFTLDGCASTQDEVARMLTRLRLMDGVANVVLQSSAKSGAGAGSSSSGSAGACLPNAPVFAAQITFDPLPTPPATVAKSTPTASTVAATPAASASAPTSTGAAG